MADPVTNNAPAAPVTRPYRRLFRWFDRRTGINALLHEALDEPIPGGARLAYVFGSGLLFLFLLQFLTGVFLVLYYVPSADHAYTTIAYITKEVTAGSFLRSLHSYGSSAMVIVLVLHVTQTFLYGSYKGRRELLWLAGCCLFALVIGMAFTGYLLPWDQKAYFATAVGTNVASEVPIIGEGIERVMRGGTAMGTLTLSRFFVLHVFVIPALIFGFAAIVIVAVPLAALFLRRPPPDLPGTGLETAAAVRSCHSRRCLRWTRRPCGMRSQARPGSPAGPDVRRTQPRAPDGAHSETLRPC